MYLPESQIVSSYHIVFISNNINYLTFKCAMINYEWAIKLRDFFFAFSILYRPNFFELANIFFYRFSEV